MDTVERGRLRFVFIVGGVAVLINVELDCWEDGDGLEIESLDGGDVNVLNVKTVLDVWLSERAEVTLEAGDREVLRWEFEGMDAWMENSEDVEPEIEDNKVLKAEALRET